MHIILCLLFMPNVSLAAGTCGSGGKTGSSPYTADSASYADVNGCLNGGNPVEAESIVYVPNGSETWTSTLTITKGVYLIGGQGGTTTITGGTASPLIALVPADYSANYAMRISGFTFNFAGKRGINLGVVNKNGPFTVQTKLRIDNNIMTSVGMDGTYPMFWDYGHFQGVIDNNTISNSNSTTAYFIRNYPGTATETWWEESPNNLYELGGQYFLYWEDNTITDTTSGGVLFNSSVDSGRFAARYNTFNFTNPAYPTFGIHGEQGVPNGDYMTSCFGVKSMAIQMTQAARKSYVQENP